MERRSIVSMGARLRGHDGSVRARRLVLGVVWAVLAQRYAKKA